MSHHAQYRRYRRRHKTTLQESDPFGIALLFLVGTYILSIVVASLGDIGAALGLAVICVLSCTVAGVLLYHQMKTV